MAQDYKQSYDIRPQITLEYNLLGLEDNQTQLKYRGMVNLNASTDSRNMFYPSSLSSINWDDDSKNQSKIGDSKYFGFTKLVDTAYEHELKSKDE